MIDLLVSIPEDIIRNRIIPFFDAKSLVKLDTATLSYEHRPNLLGSVLRNAVLGEENVEYNINMTKWLISRCMHVQYIVFPPPSEPSDIAFATPVLSQALTIDLHDCTKLTNECVQSMVRNSKSLEGIILDGCTWVNDETLQVVADNHQNLQEFILGDCPHVTDAGAAYVINKCRRVVDVQWDGCPQIGVLSMTALTNRSVENLFIASCPSIIDKHVVEFVKHNNDKLRMLILESNDQLTDLSLLAIAQHCPSLTDINVSNCPSFSDAGLCGIIQSCQSLTAFRAEDSNNVSAVVLDCMGGHISPCLEALWMVAAEDITEAHVAAITQRAPKLQTLHLGNSDALNDRAVQTIATNLPNLQHLWLAMSQVTLQGIQFLVRNCVKLTEIILTMCVLVCDRCLEDIAQQCKHLKRLCVSDNFQVTDSGLRAIAMHCTELEFVNLDYTSITDVAVEHLIDCCPALKEVELRGRAAVSQSLQRLCEQRHISLFVGSDEDQNEFEELMQLALEADGSDVESDDEDGEGSDVGSDVAVAGTATG